jgi:hypothetical protein
LKLLGIKIGVSETFPQESKNIAVTRIQDSYLLPLFSRRVALIESDMARHDVHDPALVDEWMATEGKDSDTPRIANQFEMSAMII